MDELKQELANLYGELGVATEHLAVVKDKEQSIIQHSNEILKKIIFVKERIQNESKTDSPVKSDK